MVACEYLVAFLAMLPAWELLWQLECFTLPRAARAIEETAILNGTLKGSYDGLIWAYNVGRFWVNNTEWFLWCGVIAAIAFEVVHGCKKCVSRRITLILLVIIFNTYVMLFAHQASALTMRVWRELDLEAYSYARSLRHAGLSRYVREERLNRLEEQDAIAGQNTVLENIGTNAPDSRH